MSDAAAWAKLAWRERWREVAAYQYKRLDGTVVFEHVRWATRHPSGIDPAEERPKTFRYRHRVNGQRRIGLAPDLSEREAHLIYRLPELAGVVSGRTHLKTASLATHPQGRVPPLVIAEGEKDVHALEQHGWLATTAHGGAMHGWGTYEWLWLDAIRWPGDLWLAIDDDNAGWYHAMKALRALDALRETREDLSLGAVLCRKAAVGHDPHDALEAGLGDRWWEALDAEWVTAMGEAVEHRWALAGAGGGRVNDYLTQTDVAAWKQAQMARALEQEDW